MSKDLEAILSYISVDPEICFGKPHIKGTRLKVSFILELLANKWSIPDIVLEYDHLIEDQILACIHFAQLYLEDDKNTLLAL